jgi:DNA-directed RNA polymerase beta subunit
MVDVAHHRDHWRACHELVNGLGGNVFLEEGIRELLDEINPISDFSGKKLELAFLDHEMGEIKYDAETAKAKNITYEAPLKVHVQLINSAKYL